jgi:ubiquinone/menaquinone biosynthesis C-methylase UbiE
VSNRQAIRECKTLLEKLSEGVYSMGWDGPLPKLDKCEDYELDRFTTRKGEITKNRYINATLPNLPFENRTFDLVLSSNLLFYYHNMFDYHFHLNSILELLRVTRKEVRIFPGQKPDATFPDYFDKLRDNINTRMNKNISFKIEKASHEFSRGVNKMLKINKINTLFHKTISLFV